VPIDKKFGPNTARWWGWDPQDFAEFFERILKDPLKRIERIRRK
jgi:hypothetical protein